MIIVIVESGEGPRGDNVAIAPARALLRAGQHKYVKYQKRENN